MSAAPGKLAWLWLSALVIVLDQLSKLYFENSLSLYQQIVIIPDLFSWTLAYNTGAAFSFLADAGGWQRWFFAVVALAVSVMLVIWMKGLKQHESWLAVALALVLGGALGNLFDRVVYGHVIDFVLVHSSDEEIQPSLLGIPFSHPPPICARVPQPQCINQQKSPPPGLSDVIAAAQDARPIASSEHSAIVRCLRIRGKQTQRMGISKMQEKQQQKLAIKKKGQKKKGEM